MVGAIPSTWERAERLLCIRLDSLGDVLMMTPAIRALREGAPNRQITLLTSPSGAAVARLVPEIDDVLIYEAPWVKSTSPRTDSAFDRALIRRLQSLHFDAAVIFTTFSQSPLPAALLCHLAEIPLRLAHCREQVYGLLTDRVPETEPEQGIRHEVRRQLELVATVGARPDDERLSLSVSARAGDVVRRLLRERAINTSRPWAVLHPGSTAASRRYPPELFAEATRRLVAEHGWQIVMTGSEGERDLVQEIGRLAAVPIHDLTGTLDLAKLVALIASAPVLITNNTGPSHIAAAVGTPVVCLYALTNPQHAPWMVPSRVLSQDVPCRWCYRSVCPEGHHACLRGVPPEAVVTAALELAALPRALRTSQAQSASRA
jgi:lipopolysaccharide heptosyltransferase II